MQLGRKLELPVTRWEWSAPAEDQQAGWTPDDHLAVYDAQLRLAVGGALQARIEHVSRDKVRAFAAIGPDVDSWTLYALAWLNGPDHFGRLGQSFEYQAAELVNGGDPLTLRVLSRALTLLNVEVEEPPRMVVCGLEKAQDGSIKRLLEMLPDDAVLRDGTRGRPRSAAAALAELAETSWSRMSRDEALNAADGGNGRAEVNQLGRADAFIITGRAVVPVSLKINSRHVDDAGWAGVPLWLTSQAGGFAFRRRHAAQAPTVVAALRGDYRQIRADRLLDDVLLLSRGGPRGEDLPRGRRGAYRPPALPGGQDDVVALSGPARPGSTAAGQGRPPTFRESRVLERQLVADLHLRRMDGLGAVLHYLREPTYVLNDLGAAIPKVTVRMGRLRVVDDEASVGSWRAAAEAGHLITADGTVLQRRSHRHTTLRVGFWTLMSR